MRCGLAQCPVAKSTYFSIISVIIFLQITQFCQEFNVILLIYRLAAGYSLRLHNTLDIKLNKHVLEIRTTHACVFGHGEDVVFHFIDFRLVSRSYVNTQVS
jgi:hypothetical protein